MNLVGIYKPHQAISQVYCEVCFTILKLNGYFVPDVKTVMTSAVPGLSICGYCGKDNGPDKEQIEALVNFCEINKKRKANNK